MAGANPINGQNRRLPTLIPKTPQQEHEIIKGSKMSGPPLARRNSLLKCVTWCSFLFFSISIPAIASDANGTVRFKSCAPFEFYRLDLARFQKRRLEKPIAVALPIDGVLAQMNDWTTVPGIES